MADSGGEKKHDATDHRRQKAREEGNVVRSPDLTSAVLLLAGVMLLDFTGPQVFRMMIEIINEYVSIIMACTIKTNITIMPFRFKMVLLLRNGRQEAIQCNDILKK